MNNLSSFAATVRSLDPQMNFYNLFYNVHYLFWSVRLFYCHVSLIIFICLLIEIIFFCKPTDVYKKDKNLKKTPLWLIGLSCFRPVSFSRKIASQTYEISSRPWSKTRSNSCASLLKLHTGTRFGKSRVLQESFDSFREKIYLWPNSHILWKNE